MRFYAITESDQQLLDKLTLEIKEATDEDEDQIQQYISEYLDELEHRIISRKHMAMAGKAKPLTDNKTIPERLYDHRSLIIPKIKQYGIKSNQLYKYYHSLNECEKVSKSTILPVLLEIAKKYDLESIRNIKMRVANIDEHESISYEDVDKAYKYIDESGDIHIIIKALAYSLNDKITKSDIQIALSEVAPDFGSSISYYDYKESLNSVGDIISIILPFRLFVLLEHNFLDESHWPYQDDALELLDAKLQPLTINKNKLQKLGFFKMDEYDGMKIDIYFGFMLLKQVIHNALLKQKVEK